MKRAVPWIIACVATIAFVASFSELERVRIRFGEVTRPVLFHVHADVRRAIISQQLARTEDPIVVIGDSIVEAAVFQKLYVGIPWSTQGSVAPQ